MFKQQTAYLAAAGSLAAVTVNEAVRYIKGWKRQHRGGTPSAGKSAVENSSHVGEELLPT